MVEKLIPEINKVYFINNYSLFHILDGNGSIQVDFKNYFDWEDKIIYLEKGQYIKFLSDDFIVRKIEFPNEIIFRNKEVRVLFKHLISLGYINFNECLDCQKYLSHTVFADDPLNIIDVSSEQWFWQNPFQADKEEYQIIFDAKEIIDQQFSNQLTAANIADLINKNGYKAQSLIRDKVGLSIKSLFANKKLIESKKQIAFTDKNIQEIAFDVGYNDPAYFNRVFKSETGQSPNEFRNDFDYENRDQFAQDIISLLRMHHMQEHKLIFYADKMNLSVKALSKKVRNKLNVSLGQLIRLEIINSAKKMLDEESNVNDVAYQLGFEEANHFSTFFKHYTELSPLEYQSKKYKS